jgi:hypothetical protein
MKSNGASPGSSGPATGRLVCGVLGLVLIAAGAVLSLTVVGAPIGIALGVLGLLLLCRAIF